MSAETFPDGTIEQETDTNMGQEDEYSDDVEMNEDIDEPVEKQMKAEMTPEQLSTVALWTFCRRNNYSRNIYVLRSA